MTDWAEEDVTRYSSYVECALDPQGAADTVKGVHEEVVRLSQQVQELGSLLADANETTFNLRGQVARVEALCTELDEIPALVDTATVFRKALRGES